MPIIPNFTSSESLSSPNLVTFSDTSTGDDVNITSRQIYIQLADGTYLKEAGTLTDYEVWDYADASIVLDILARSQSANVTVVWLNGSTLLYTKTILMEWNLYDYLFLFGLLQLQTSEPYIISDSNYYDNHLKMIVNLFNSENAVLRMDDLYSSQAALDKNYWMIQHQNLFF